MTLVHVAAGSNVRPIVNLRRALDVLVRRFPDLRCSRAYRNTAVGFEGDDFINLVAEFDTSLPVHDVLAILYEAEAACGRERNAPRWAPRSMDLDILLYGDHVCEVPGLVLPRPDLLRRAYMLGPMAELAPDRIHPVAHATMKALWADFDQAAHPMQPVDLDWPTKGSRA